MIKKELQTFVATRERESFKSGSPKCSFTYPI